MHGRNRKDLNCLPNPTLSNSPLRRNRFLSSICVPRHQVRGSESLAIPWPGEKKHFCSSSRILFYSMNLLFDFLAGWLVDRVTLSGEMSSRLLFALEMEPVFSFFKPHANCKNNFRYVHRAVARKKFWLRQCLWIHVTYDWGNQSMVEFSS